jgi:hypothetical protein
MRKGRPLVAGYSRVIANGKLKIELKTVDGNTVVYIAEPVTIWRYKLDKSVRPKVIRIVPASPADRVRQALDAALDEIVTLEKRARAASSDTAPNIAA